MRKLDDIGILIAKLISGAVAADDLGIHSGIRGKVYS
jgi:hypothetical protein